MDKARHIRSRAYWTGYPGGPKKPPGILTGFAVPNPEYKNYIIFRYVVKIDKPESILC